jgi:hypothetical protein|nr:hypothetical protein [Kofleriaceae bacterium]
MMNALSIVLVAAAATACGSPPPPQPPTTGGDTAPHDTRTPIEQRRDTACEALGKRTTACAVDDAAKSLASGVGPDGKPYTKDMYERDTSRDVQAKNTSVFVDKCQKQHLNSYQVRVYEVCMHEERDCDPMLQCLQHVTDPQPAH